MILVSIFSWFFSFFWGIKGTEFIYFDLNRLFYFQEIRKKKPTEQCTGRTLKQNRHSRSTDTHTVSKCHFYYKLFWIIRYQHNKHAKYENSYRIDTDHVDDKFFTTLYDCDYWDDENYGDWLITQYEIVMNKKNN